MSGLAGIDEVGRGSLAGPVCVAAVVLGNAAIEGLNDSKLVGRTRRERLAAEIVLKAEKVGIGWASSGFIDSYGIVRALEKAAEAAVGQLGLSVGAEIIVDGTANFLKSRRNVSLLKKADQLIPAVSAASLVAKVARDSYMRRVDYVFPGYGFKSHVGYGTAAHLAAIQKLGPCRLHRFSFAPIGALLPKPAAPPGSGSLAENAAAASLNAAGYQIIDRNWKTRRCEVDIIALKGNYLFFIEVKYRQRASAGRGLDYVTTSKRRQMRYAAEVWLSRHLSEVPIVAAQPVLAAVEVSGRDFTVGRLLPVED